MAHKMELRTAEAGYIQYGHLYGHRAFIIELADKDTPLGDRLFLSKADVGRLAVQSRVTRIFIHFTPSALAACRELAQYLSQAIPSATVSIGLSPGAVLQYGELQNFESMLLLRRGELYVPTELERLAGSVSVNYWPGSDSLNRLTELCDAPYGYFMVLPKEDIGHAKIWLSATGNAVWQIIPQYDFDTDEVEEMTHRFRGTK